MNRTLVFAAAGTILIALVAWSSLAVAAPATVGTVLAPSAATATPVPPAPGSGLQGASVGAPDVAPPKVPAGAVDPGSMTSRILIFNLDTGNTATVGINFLDTTGKVVATITPFPISPNGAVAQPVPGTSSFNGSAVVSSDKNVQAYVTDSNAGNTARDEYDGTLLPSPNLTLPFVRHLAPNNQNSIIAVQNTGTVATDITLQLYQPNGSLGPSKKQTGVAPLASAYFDTGALTFPAPGTFTGTAEISSSGGVALAASEQTRFLQDTASFRALTSADDSTKLYVGFVERRTNSLGVPTAWSEIYVRNDGSAPTDITATFYSSAGTAVTTTVQANVPINGLAKFLTNDPSIKTAASSYFMGWASITSSGQPMSSYSLENQVSGARLFGTNGIAATGTKLACGDTFRVSSPAQYSNLNIVNPSTGGGLVTINLYAPGNGGVAGTKSVWVGAKQLVSVLLSDPAFSSAGPNFEGLAVVSSNSPQIFASSYTTYPLGGVISYTCSRLQ